jgi:murein DD-endopeptidase MepM/ murein hydrolase activator NlpD
MSKVKYHFNTKSLAVEKVNQTLWDKMKVILRYMLAGMVFSIIVLITGYTFFESPKEKMQARAIRQYEEQIQMFHERLDLMNMVLGDLQERDDHIYRVIFEAEPISRTQREAGFGGTNPYLKFEGFQNSEQIASLTRRMDQMARHLVVQSSSYDEVFEMAKNKSNMLASIPAIMPVRLGGSNRLVSGFGMRIHPIYKTLRMHEGVDFSAPPGTPIYATGNGVIIEASRNHGYGLTVVVDHGFGYQTRYAHMSSFKVRRGQRVVRGEVIGLVGNTGTSTAPHLHYEVIRNGRKVNPVSYFYNDLSPAEFEEIIRAASRVNQSLS